MTTALVAHGAGRARIGPWHGGPTVGCVTPQPGSPPISVRLVQRCLEQLGTLGFREAITAAMPAHEAAGFVAAGFHVSERLHLLDRSLTRADRAPVSLPNGVTLRRGRTREINDVLVVDTASFGPFWRLDVSGVQDARRATAYARFRIATLADEIVGYAITGQQGRTGYLQRLADDAARRHTGIATALVTDGLRWLGTGVYHTGHVNTHANNDTGPQLYNLLAMTRKHSGTQTGYDALDQGG